MQKMEIQAVNLRAELREVVQSRFCLSPIVMVRPVIDQSVELVKERLVTSPR